MVDFSCPLGIGLLFEVGTHPLGHGLDAACRFATQHDAFGPHAPEGRTLDERLQVLDPVNAPFVDKRSQGETELGRERLASPPVNEGPVREAQVQHDKVVRETVVRNSMLEIEPLTVQNSVFGKVFGQTGTPRRSPRAQPPELTGAIRAVSRASCHHGSKRRVEPDRHVRSVELLFNDQRCVPELGKHGCTELVVTRPRDVWDPWIARRRGHGCRSYAERCESLLQMYTR